MVGTGEGTNEWIRHTYGIIERYIPSQIKPMRTAQPAALAARFHRDQRGSRPGGAGLDAAAGRDLRLASGGARLDDLTLLAATVSFAVLGNAFICAVISGPHDRYGARLAWVATFVVLIAAIRIFPATTSPLTHGADRNSRRLSCKPCRRPHACGRGWEYPAPSSPG